MKVGYQLHNWELHGVIFRPKSQGLSWMQSHAWLPTPYYAGGGNIFLYFATRNKHNLSQIGRLQLNLNRPEKITNLSMEPVLKLGQLGCFDDSAVLPSQVFVHDGKLKMIYIGWMQGKNVPFHAALGLAESQDFGETFHRYSQAPIIDRNEIDPIFVSSAYVQPQKRGYLAWYTSAVAWNKHGDNLKENYLIKLAAAETPFAWQRRGEVAIGQSGSERAISRPWVLQSKDKYMMWYSYRSHSYDIGYAESENGVSWYRRDEENKVPKSPCGFDSQMQEYAAVIEYKKKLFMFYNGNNFGEEGIALASANIN